jgi:hypothetical protein
LVLRVELLEVLVADAAGFAVGVVAHRDGRALLGLLFLRFLVLFAEIWRMVNFGSINLG